MSDLVSGRYSAQNPNWGLWGKTNNIVQSDVPAISNISPGTTLVDGAAVITKEITFVPVQVPEGIEISKVSMFVGGTKMEAVTTNWVALYTGPGAEAGGSGAKGEIKPKLIAQSANSTTAVAATTTATYELEKKVLVTPERAPNGYLYVAIAAESTKVGTFASFEVAAALTKSGGATLKVFPWLTNAPITFKTKPSSLTSTAPEEPTETVVVAVIPALVLT